jgi:hypothetical protein
MRWLLLAVLLGGCEFGVDETGVDNHVPFPEEKVSNRDGVYGAPATVNSGVLDGGATD